MSYIMETDISYNETPRNEYIEQITMELLMSKPKYKRYLENKDPVKYINNVTYKRNVENYKHIIKDIIEEEFKNILSERSSRTDEIRNSFSDFLKNCIQYIKTKELETENPFNRSSNAYEDEDIFEKCDAIEQQIKDNMTKDITCDYDDEADADIVNANTIKYDIRMLARKKR